MFPSLSKANPNFLDLSEPRLFPEDVPQKLEDHIAQDKKLLASLDELEQKVLYKYPFLSEEFNPIIRSGKKYEYYSHTKDISWKDSEREYGGFADREDLISYLKTLDKILKHRSRGRRILYRGTPIYSSLHDEIGESVCIKDIAITDIEGLVKGLNEYYKPGNIIHYKTPVSTTYSAGYAASRAKYTTEIKRGNYIDGTYHQVPEISGIVFEIKTNAGLDIVGMVGGEKHRHEREVLLPRDTYFKIANLFVQPEVYKPFDFDGDYRSYTGDLAGTYSNLAAVVQMVEIDAKGNEITCKRHHKPSKSVESIITK